MSACLSYKSAYQRRRNAESPRRWFSIWFTAADWWCLWQMKRKWKMCLDFFFSFLPPPNHWDEREELIRRQPCYHLCVCHTRAHSLHTDRHAHTPRLLRIRHTHTPTYVAAAVLADGVRARPHLPKCRCWTDCGGVMNGWSRLGRGAEETISAMLISPLLLRPPSIPHSPVLCLRSAPVLSQSIIASLTPSSFLSTPHPLSLSHNAFAPYHHDWLQDTWGREGTGINGKKNGEWEEVDAGTSRGQLDILSLYGLHH